MSVAKITSLDRGTGSSRIVRHDSCPKCLDKGVVSLVTEVGTFALSPERDKNKKLVAYLGETILCDRCDGSWEVA